MEQIDQKRAGDSATCWLCWQSEANASIHAFAVATGFALTGTLASAPAIGLSLPGIYFIWLLVLVLLYPICRWFSDLKAGGRGWWWGAIYNRCRGLSISAYGPPSCAFAATQ